MHVGVDAAVGVERREGLVPLLHDHAVVVVPEVLEEHAERLVQQLATTRPVGGRRAGRGDHHEGVFVGRLVGGHRAFGADLRVPPAVLPVAEPVMQCLDAVVG